MKKWIQKEEDYIRDNYVTLGLYGCAQAMGKSIAATSSKAVRMGLIRTRRLTDLEKDYLILNGETMPIFRIAANLTRSWNFIDDSLKRLGIVNQYDNSKKWEPTEEELTVLRSGKCVAELSEELNRCRPTILKRLRLMGLSSPRKKREFTGVIKKEPKTETSSVPRISSESRIKQALERLGI